MEGFFSRLAAAAFIISLAVIAIVAITQGSEFLTAPEMIIFYKAAGTIIVILIALSIVRTIFLTE